MKKLAVALLATAAGVVAVRHRARKLEQVSADLRKGNPLLYLPLSVTNRGALMVMRRLPAPPNEVVAGVFRREVVVGEALRLILYDPDNRSADSGVLLWVHGGGRVAGDVAQEHRQCSHLAREAGVLVVSVDYRLAPEHPFPAALDDIMAALVWVRKAAGSLGIDPQRIAIGGASAGGGLAAEAAQRALDEGVPVAFQLLKYPMLDDRTVSVDSEGRGHLIWTPASNRFGWRAYLGHTPPDSPYAVAARRQILSGLPPAWIGVGDLDLFYAESLEYARRLTEAGVPVVLDVVPGMYHAADVVSLEPPPSMRQFWQGMADALRRGLATA